ncbi:hypothetical protein L7F22_060129 [Adiantum nelumboides]|nr:hypothetical protein [Adiantum nelumboides]
MCHFNAQRYNNVRPDSNVPRIKNSNATRLAALAQMGDGELAKALLPYLRRANEIQKYEPLVAYHCRCYARNRVLKIRSIERTKSIEIMLSTLDQQLAKDTKSIQLSSKDSLYIENFAMSMFMRADKQERCGNVEMRTAKTFYAASLFFEILQNFGGVRLDVQEKQRYAAWRAAEIHKTLKAKANRGLKDESQPFSVLPASDKALAVSKDGFRRSLSKAHMSVDPIFRSFPLDECLVGGPKTNSGKEQLPYLAMLSKERSSDSSFTFDAVSTSSMGRSTLSNQDETDDEEAFYDCSDADLSSLSSSDSEHESDQQNVSADVTDESSHPSALDILKAQKVARLAVSAIAFDDVPSAISYLEQALDLLTNNSWK